MIPCQELLKLLEGQSVYLVAPKTHYATDVINTDDVAIFATSIASILFAGKSFNIEGDNKMMEASWRKIQLSVQILLSEQKTAKS